MEPLWWILMKSWGVLVPVVHLLGIVCAVHAIMSSRTPQGAIAWAFSLVTLPWLSLPIYAIAGRRRFDGYVMVRREGDDEIKSRFPVIQDAIAALATEIPDQRFARATMPLAGMPYTGGNEVQLLTSGEEAFEEMFAAIDEAKDYILVFFFIVRDDGLGKRFQQMLMKKAKEGVKVCFGYDEIGSRKLTRSYLVDLEVAGVEVRSFRTMHGIRRMQINFRNHRKILIADGEVGFVGGLNVADEYLGRHPEFGRWRDTHLRIKGPSVACLQVAFLEDWNWMGGDPEGAWNWAPEAPQTETYDETILIAPTGPADRLPSAQLIFVSAAEAAEKRLWIASPYFVPDDGVVAALQAAAIRGVDVRILMPGRPDQLLVYLSSFTYYREMLDAGVQLYRYSEGFLHQKVFVMDDDWAVVGTANLDNRSFRLNFEIFVIGYLGTFAQEVSDMLEDDFCGAERVELEDFTERPWLFRLACRLARLLAPVQ